jgi:hypothetical protein
MTTRYFISVLEIDINRTIAAFLFSVYTQEFPLIVFSISLSTLRLLIQMSLMFSFSFSGFLKLTAAAALIN